MTQWNICVADVIEWARAYNGEKFHAMLTDCPYEYGFMGKSWDSSGVSFKSETWAALGEHLHPGAFCMTFGGARTWHRIAVAIEDAGFIIHPSIFVWAYSSGFPKAARIDTQIDRMLGEYDNREVVGKHPNPASEIFRGGKMSRDVELTDAATSEAAIWTGHRYGLQAMKPAAEPIIFFQKPYDRKSVLAIMETGAGALWIDGARIASGDELGRDNKSGPFQSGRTWFVSNTPGQNTVGQVSGKWPANFALVHSPGCQIVGFEDAESYPINRYVDGAKPFGGGAGHEYETIIVNGGVRPIYECVDGCPASSLGKEARHFFAADWQLELLEAEQVAYCSKPSPSERDGGLHEYPTKGVEELSGGGGYSKEYQGAYQARKSPRKNPHPTIKPIALNLWLSRLLLPPAAYSPRRLLVPFGGVCSESIGAMLAGWEQIEVVEIDESNAEIGSTRMFWWGSLAQHLQTTDVATLVKASRKETRRIEAAIQGELPL